MNNFWLVFKREYLFRIKNKWFWITTFMIPIGIILIYLIPILLVSFGEQSKTKLILLNSEQYLEEAQIKPQSENLSVDKVEGSLDEAKSKINQENSEINAIIDFGTINPLENNYNVKVLSKDTLSLGQETDIKMYLDNILQQLKLQKENIPLDQAVRLNTPITPIFESLEAKNPTADQAYFLAYIAGFIMYFILIYYGTNVMQSIQEEKRNRIVEILLTAINPMELLFGKVLGVISLGVTQILLWVSFVLISIPILSFVFTSQASQILDQNTSIIEQIKVISSNLNLITFLPIFFMFLLLGVILYAGLFAIISVSVDNDADMQAFSGIAIVPIIIGFMMSLSIVMNPNTNLAVVASMIPFISPLTMIARIPFGVPAWQIIVSIILLFLSAIFMIWLSSKIYKIGVLLYGEKLSWKHIKLIFKK